MSVQLSPVDMGGGPRLNAQLALSRRVPIPEGLRLVAYVPSEATRFSFASADKTNEMRALLPPDVPREQAVFNIQRTALLIDCLHRGDLSLLRFATEDVLHQPARATIYPHLKPMCQAAINAGAHGAFLSGAGPTILAICSARRAATSSRKRGRAPGERRRERHAEGRRLPSSNTTSGRGFYICSRATRAATSSRPTRPCPTRWRRSARSTGHPSRAAAARARRRRSARSGALARRRAAQPTTFPCARLASRYK